MIKTRALLLITLLVAALAAQPASAQIQIGETAPNFTKQELTPTGPGAFISLYDYSDKDVVILFILGHG